MRVVAAFAASAMALAALSLSPAPAASAEPVDAFLADGSTTPLQDQLVADLATAAADHRSVRLPAGTFHVTRTMWLPPGSTLVLDTAATISGSIPGQSLIRLQSHSTISGGTVANTAESDCLDVDVAPSSRDALIEHVTFRGDHTNAVYVNAPDVRNMTIRQNRFVGSVYGVLVNPGAFRARGIIVSDNEFLRITGDAIEINAAIPRAEDLVRDVTISRNKITDMRGAGDGSGFAIGVAGVQGFRIGDNRIVGARSEALHLEDRASGGAVERNRIIGGGGGGWRPAIAIYRTVDSVQIKSNLIDGFRGDGVAVLWDSVGSSTRIRIWRNVIRRVTGGAIVVGGNAGTGPFSVRRNFIDAVGGGPITVLGTHARSVVADNMIRRTSGALVATRYQGAGIRVYRNNGSMPRVEPRSVVGEAADLLPAPPHRRGMPLVERTTNAKVTISKRCRPHRSRRIPELY